MRDSSFLSNLRVGRYAVPMLLAAFAALATAPPAAATVIAAGDVAPGGLGPGDTTLSTGLAVGGASGGATSGSLVIDNGSQLVLQQPLPFATVAGPAGSFGTVTVRGGAGGTPSQLRLEGTDGFDGAFLNVGRNGDGIINIEDGGRVEIDSKGAQLGRLIPGLGAPAGFNLGRNAGGSGVVNITGAGSELSVTSAFAYGAIGRSGDGEMNVTAGGLLSFSGINGDLNVGSDTGASAPGLGVLNVNSGGRVEGPVFLDVGATPGGRGVVDLAGAGSSIELRGACTPDCPVGFSYPNQGAFLTLGANEGAGEMTIRDGAQMLIDSAQTEDARHAGFTLGGSSILGPRGDGILRVEGPGSELRVRGDENFFAVGRLEDGKGLLEIRDGGRVVLENDDGLATGFVGDRPGATGTVLIEGTGALLDAGSYLGIGVDQAGAAAGKGTVELVQGGTLKADRIVVDNGGTISGSGTLTASSAGGTLVTVETNGTIDVGSSTGAILVEGDLVLNGGSLLLEADGPADLDRITVTGDLLFDTGFLDVVLGFTPDPGLTFDFFDVLGSISVAESSGGIRARAAPGSGVPAGTPVALELDGRLLTARITAVPEPASLAAIMAGLVGIGGAARLRRRKGPGTRRSRA
ncbi:MAG: PEP-CTERM sorting domain-containing protein [Tistlia sp.]|uniref:PEP-CTERM sorting domain-containing protein n=1 Tax=Tistlia sp. TaxID=3057121 RepID=UPI0034A0DCCB